MGRLSSVEPVPGAEKFGIAGLRVAIRQPAQVFGKRSDWQAAPQVRTTSSRRTPQLSEQLLQSERKGELRPQGRCWTGPPPNPQRPSAGAQRTQGLRWELRCFKVKSEPGDSARCSGSCTKTETRSVSGCRLNVRGSSPANPRPH